MNDEILGVIPARGGSKGIKGKNLKLIGKKSLVAWAIKEAIESNIFTDLVVSTDCPKIFHEAKKAGLKPPFLRPKYLAGDRALATETVRHAVKKMEKIKEKKYAFIFMIQPTSPGRKPDEFLKCLKILRRKKTTGVISFKKYQGQHPFKMVLLKNGLAKEFYKWAVENPPRQCLPDIYVPDGAFYAFKRATIIKHKSFRGKNCRPFLRKKSFISIDTNQDLQNAKKILQ